MKKSTVSATVSSDIEKIWNIVTDNSNYTWRSDLSKISVSDDGSSFTEYTKDGFETLFTITVKEPFARYEFDIKNRNMTGHWVGIFSKHNSGTQIEFTEVVNVRSPIMNLFIGAYLKKQQSRYIADLRKALRE